MISTMAFMNVYLLFIILLGFSYINFWVPFVLSLNLFIEICDIQNKID